MVKVWYAVPGLIFQSQDSGLRSSSSGSGLKYYFCRSLFSIVVLSERISCLQCSMPLPVVVGIRQWLWLS